MTALARFKGLATLVDMVATRRRARAVADGSVSTMVTVALVARQPLSR